MKSGDFQALMDRIEAIEKYIYQVEPKKPPLQEIWLDNEVVCSYLKISKRTLQRYRSNGVITYSLIGKKTYYTISDIKRLLEEKRIQRNVGSLEELAAKGLMTLPKDYPQLQNISVKIDTNLCRSLMSRKFCKS